MGFCAHKHEYVHVRISCLYPDVFPAGQERQPTCLGSRIAGLVRPPFVLVSVDQSY